MPIEERCPTKLLDDTPADTDDFGGHESVARSIAELVRTEAGGKAIGLEGGWGAGKSTIVNLASTILNETKNGQYRTVVFDTWAHQGDPLRRTFLENLITRIRAFNWVNRKKWHSRLAALTKRRSEETTRVIPRLEPHRYWVCPDPIVNSCGVGTDICWRYASGIPTCIWRAGSLAFAFWHRGGISGSDLLRRCGHNSVLEN